MKLTVLSVQYVNYDYVCFQNASCSSHRSSSFSEVSVLRCVISVWSAPSNACVIFTDGVSEEHQSRSVLLRRDAGLLQTQRDWSESSEDGHQSPDECENLLLLHTDWWLVTIIYNTITESRSAASAVNQPDTCSLTQSSIEKEPLLKTFTAKLLKIGIMFDFWLQFLCCGSNWPIQFTKSHTMKAKLKLSKPFWGRQTHRRILWHFSGNP